MEIIGEGFYYKVYSLEDGRVLKKFQPWWFSFKKIFLFNRKKGKSFFDSILGAWKSRRRETKALLSMKNKLQFIPLNLFAKPKFVKELDYSQDMVRVVSEVMPCTSFEQGKNIIDQYINFHRALWLFGLHDKTYKFETNYGINNQNKIICLDFGEFVFTKTDAWASMQTKKWLKRGSYECWPNDNLKKYYTENMENLMTRKNLDMLWERKVL